MYYDLLVHVDWADKQCFVMALNNISNYITALGDQLCQVVLLPNDLGRVRSKHD